LPKQSHSIKKNEGTINSFRKTSDKKHTEAFTVQQKNIVSKPYHQKAPIKAFSLQGFL